MSASALKKAKVLSLYGWDKEVADEYLKPVIRAGCDPAKASRELERIFDAENRIPGHQELIANAKKSGAQDRWITFEREVIGHGKISFARQVPNDNTPPEDHLRPGETLLSDTAEPAGIRCQWNECEAGRQLHAMLERMTGKPKRGEGFTQAGKVLEGEKNVNHDQKSQSRT